MKQGLAGARTASDNGQIVPEHHLDALGLPRGQGDAELPPHLFHHGPQIDRLRNLQRQLRNLAGRLAFLCVNMGQIDISALGDNDVCEDHCLQRLLHLLLSQRYFRRGDVLVEEFQRRANKLADLHIEVATLPARLFQRVEQRSLYPHGVVQVAARLSQDGVDAFETEAGNLAEPERAFADQLHAAGAEVLVDLHRRGRRYLKNLYSQAGRAGWARNFPANQGASTQTYFVYFKEKQRSMAGKDPLRWC